MSLKLNIFKCLHFIGKWYTPKKYHPDDYALPFTYGPFYIMVGKLSQRLMKTIDQYEGYILFIDDLFIGGIIAEKAGIKRFKHKLILQKGGNYYRGAFCKTEEECVFCKSAVRIQCTAERQLQLWSQFKKSDESNKTLLSWPLKSGYSSGGIGPDMFGSVLFSLHYLIFHIIYQLIC